METGKEVKIEESNFERFVVRKAVDEYWRAEEKVIIKVIDSGNGIPEQVRKNYLNHFLLLKR